MSGRSSRPRRRQAAPDETEDELRARQRREQQESVKNMYGTPRGYSWAQHRRWLEKQSPKRSAGRKQAWTGWGRPMQRVAGWDFDHRLNGYVTTAADRFSCDCGEEFDTPSGYRKCGSCGRAWNSYVIGTDGHGREASLEKVICREIPVRKDVIVASKRSRKVAGPQYPRISPKNINVGNPQEQENLSNFVNDALSAAENPYNPWQREMAHRGLQWNWGHGPHGTGYEGPNGEFQPEYRPRPYSMNQLTYPGHERDQYINFRETKRYNHNDDDYSPESSYAQELADWRSRNLPAGHPDGNLKKSLNPYYFQDLSDLYDARRAENPNMAYSHDERFHQYHKTLGERGIDYRDMENGYLPPSNWKPGQPLVPARNRYSGRPKESKRRQAGQRRPFSDYVNDTGPNWPGKTMVDFNSPTWKTDTNWDGSRYINGEPVFPFVPASKRNKGEKYYLTYEWGHPKSWPGSPDYEEHQATCTDCANRMGHPGAVNHAGEPMSISRPKRRKGKYQRRHAAGGEMSHKGKCQCWDGYERVPGTKPCAPGSCRKCDNHREARRYVAWCKLVNRRPHPAGLRRFRTAERIVRHATGGAMPEGKHDLDVANIDNQVNPYSGDGGSGTQIEPALDGFGTIQWRGGSRRRRADRHNLRRRDLKEMEDERDPEDEVSIEHFSSRRRRAELFDITEEGETRKGKGRTDTPTMRKNPKDWSDRRQNGQYTKRWN